MVGPSRAVSGVATATVSVMETFRALIGERPAAVVVRPPTSTPHQTEWSGGTLSDSAGPTYEDPVAGTSIEAALPLVESTSANGTSSEALTPTGAHAAAGAPGYRRSGGGAGGASAPSGAGGISARSPEGLLSTAESWRVEELGLTDITTDLGVSDLVSGRAGLSLTNDAFGDDFENDFVRPPANGGSGVDAPSEAALVPPAGLVAAGPSGSGAGPSGVPFVQDDVVAVNPPALSSAGGPPSGPGGSVGDRIPPLITQVLADELGIPNSPDDHSSVPPDGSGARSSNGGPSVAQIPEPSTLLLLSLGWVALEGRRRRRREQVKR